MIKTTNAYLWSSFAVPIELLTFIMLGFYIYIEQYISINMLLIPAILCLFEIIILKRLGVTVPDRGIGGKA